MCRKVHVIVNSYNILIYFIVLANRESKHSQ